MVMNSYQYIHFKVLDDTRKTTVWQCLSNRSNDCLGLVKWYGPWRQYCFFPFGETVFNVGCMNDVCDFIKRQRDERKKKLA